MAQKKVVIFGSGDMAELAKYYFEQDSEYSVAGFALDQQYIEGHECLGLPMVPFENIEKHFPSSDYFLFVALSYSNLNELRKRKYLEGKKKGYQFASYVSSKATILNGHNFGENVFVLEDNTIQPFVNVGDNVTLWSGNHIGHHSNIQSHVFIASHVVVSGGVTVGEQSFVGVNATLRDHIQIGKRSVVGAGCLILASTKDDSLYVGSRTSPKDRLSSTIKKI